MSEFSVVGEPGVQKMLDEYAPQPRQNLERRAVRAGANVVKRQMAFEAETAGHPHSFMKIRVRVSASMRSGGIPHAIVRPASPLFNIFEPGAGAHEIAPGLVGGNSSRPSRPTSTAARASGKGALAGKASENPGTWDNAGRKRAKGFYSTRPVRHPGLRARPILPAVMSSAGRSAIDAMAAVIFHASDSGERP